MNIAAQWAKENVLKPALRRVGTAVGVLLLSGGNWACAHLDACGLVTQNGADVVIAYAIGVICLGFDLLVSYLEKRAVKAKAASAALAAVRPGL